MRTRDTEVFDAFLSIELPIQQSCRIFDELEMGTVQLSERLLVLALYHHLGLGEQRALTKRLDVLNPDLFAGRFFQADTRLAPLGMRHAVNTTRIPRMFRQLGRARARRRIYKIEMNESPILARPGEDTFEGDIIELVSLQPTSETLMQHRVRETYLQSRVLAFHLLEIRTKDFSHPFPGKNFVLVVVKRAHDPAHV